MPTISRFYGIRIRMYYDELHGPHFHADYAGESAQISLADGRVMSGRLSTRAFRLVSDWAGEHHSELMENWERARRGRKLKSILPLQ